MKYRSVESAVAIRKRRCPKKHVIAGWAILIRQAILEATAKALIHVLRGFILSRVA